MGVIGGAIIGFSGFLIQQNAVNDAFNTEAEDESLGADFARAMNAALYGMLIVGVLITLPLALKCCCKTTIETTSVVWKRCFGVAYVVIGIVVLCLGAGMLVLNQWAHSLAFVPVRDLGAGVASGQQVLYDVSLGVFDGCCVPLSPAPEDCPPASGLEYCLFFEQDVAYETGLNVSSTFCDAVAEGNSLGWCKGVVVGDAESLNDFHVAAYDYAHPILLYGGVSFVLFSVLLCAYSAVTCGYRTLKGKDEPHLSIKVVRLSTPVRYSAQRFSAEQRHSYR